MTATWKGCGVNEEQVRGLPVYGVADGRELGKVAHVYLDPVSRRVIAFGVLPVEEEPEEAPGALDPTGAAFLASPRGLAFLASGEVRSIGQDAVMVEDGSALRDEPPGGGTGELVALDALDGRDVVTDSGSAVGQLATVAFDPTSFGLASIEVARGLLRRRSVIPAALVLDLTGDPVVVDGEADPAAIAAGRDEDEGDDADDEVAAEPVIIERGERTTVRDQNSEVDTRVSRRRPRKSRKAPSAPRGERQRREGAGAT